MNSFLNYLGKSYYQTCYQTYYQTILKLIPNSICLQVGRLVVVVIDALRADFVLDPQETKERPKISWLTEALERGDGRAWVARVSPPTVTLPRFYPPSDPVTHPSFTL